MPYLANMQRMNSFVEGPRLATAGAAECLCLSFIRPH